MNQKKKLMLGFGILVAVVTIIGISYAVWILITQQTNMNKLGSSCFSLSLTEEKNNIHLRNAYPITDEDGKKLTPYSFTITNTCDLRANYTVNLEILENSTLPIEYLKVMVNNEQMKTLDQYETTTTTLTGATASKVLAKGSLDAGNSEEYFIRLWIDENVTVDSPNSMNQLFRSKVVIVGQIGNYSPCEYEHCKLGDAILANEYQTTPDKAKEKINQKQAPDFTKTAPIMEWQENHASDTATITATMPHPELVGNSDSKYASLTSENILPRIGTSYSFDKETGQYTIGNLEYVDLATLDYNGEINYYYCGSGFNTNADDVVQPYSNYENCTTIYKMVGATTENSTTTGTGGTVIKTKVYTITGYKYTQNEIESDKSDKGLYQATENEQPIYYYRGKVNNNYVQFAGLLWRVVRVDANGNVRVVLNDNVSTKSKYSSNYYTGQVENIEAATSLIDYKNSDVKQSVEEWYNTNIVPNEESKFVVNSNFCIDLSYEDPIKTQYEHTVYYYTPYIHVGVDAHTFSLNFTCAEEYIFASPVGLLSAEEIFAAGAYWETPNNNYYLFNQTVASDVSQTSWTMSGSYYSLNEKQAGVIVFNQEDKSLFDWVQGGNLQEEYGYRPVISLNGNTKVTGIGTRESPYQLIN